MLKQRIITAVVLLAILLPALFYPSPWPFAIVSLVLIAAGAWEWGRFSGLADRPSMLVAAACVVLCGAFIGLGVLAQPMPRLWLLMTACWVIVGAGLLRAGVGSWTQWPRAVRVIAGLAVLAIAWLALAQARERGINFLLSVLVLVWVADIGAYFAGRAFGRRKLAPAISPGKSWEGVWGGMAGVVVLALAWVWLDQRLQPASASLYTELAQRGWAYLLLAVIFMAAMSVVGDLVESLIKRSVGVKDSSALLPGHRGVLDRVDALLPTLPLAMMLVSL